VGDSKLVKKVGKQVGATYYKDYGLYTIKCNATYDPISFSINGKVYNLTSDVLTMDIGIGYILPPYFLHPTLAPYTFNRDPPNFNYIPTFNQSRG